MRRFLKSLMLKEASLESQAICKTFSLLCLEIIYKKTKKNVDTENQAVLSFRQIIKQKSFFA